MELRGEGGPRAPAGTPISMVEAVGYSSIDCLHEASIEDLLVLKHDRLFLMIDSHGNITPPGRCGAGLFHDDTRILSHYELSFTGGPPALLSSKAPEVFNAQIDLAINDRDFGGLAWDPKNVVYIRRDMLLDDRLTERITLTSYVPAPLEFEVRLALGCDFADIFEVRGWMRPHRGAYTVPRTGAAELEYTYRGLDGATVSTIVRFREPPDDLGQYGAIWRFRLLPHQPLSFEWQISPGFAPEAADRGLSERAPHAREIYDGWRRECTCWTTDVEQFNDALNQAITDLRALYVRDEDAVVISAGIPWYSTVFGRDSIITSLETLPTNPRIAVDTLRYLARHQGRKEDRFTEEQPGKILHELRRGEMARAGEIPHVPYYGTIDATPLWLVLLHETWRWTGNEALIRELLPNARRALEWIDRYGDVDGDGLVEYASTSEKGLVNQGWKDSSDGVPFPDGELPEPPIALVEVQGYVYDAHLRMAALYTTFGEPDEAERLKRKAAALRERIVERFWLEEQGTFALALDGEKRPLPTITTNAGHLLWSRVPDEQQARRMAATFLAPEMFSGWGLRTVSAAHPVFNPMSYHNGSIWPHDNALVALGLAHYGETDAALSILSGLYAAAHGMRYHRLPELFCGMARGTDSAHPVLYPVSCSPQGWSAGAFFMLLQAAMGILPDAAGGVVHIREPRLPDFLREMVVSRLRVGDSRITLRFTRHGPRTLVNLLATEGKPIQVRIELT